MLTLPRIAPLGALAVILVAASPTHAATPPPSPEIQGPALSTALNDLSAQLKELSGRDGKAGQTGRMLSGRRGTVFAALKAKRTCEAASGLLALRRSARGATDAPLELRSGILASSLNAEAILRSRPTTAGCGQVGRAPTSVGVARAMTSSPAGVGLRVQLPALRFAPVVGAGRALVKPIPTGLGSTATGMPEIPSLTRMVAVPLGARVAVKLKAIESYVVDGVDISPTQPDPNAQAPNGRLEAYPGADSPLFAPAPFSYSTAQADSPAPYPRRPVTIKPLGQLGGLQVVAISVPIGQYVGKSRRMKVFTSMDLDLTFPGAASVAGKPSFGSTQLVGSGLDDLRALAPLIPNLKVAFANLTKVAVKPCGAKLVIITTPELRAAAEELAAMKRAAGLTTLVTDVGAGPGKAGATAPEIATYLRDLRKTDCADIPRNVILYGKAIPSFLRAAKRKNAGEPSHATDYPYSLRVDGEVFAVVGLGRLPAKTLDEARVLNAKIQQWMVGGPADPDFYRHTLVAGLFQTDGDSKRESQSFIQSLEGARRTMISSARVVDRLYDADSGAQPTFFQDGSGLPADLMTYPWSTEKGDEVTAAINDGRSIVLHDDHGYDYGWGDPGFNTTGVESLTNGAELPLVWSINCYSGRYDDPNVVSFAESMVLKSGGGALGVLASSRMSNTQTNGVFAQVLAKTVFPEAFPGIPSFQGATGLGSSTNAAKVQTFFELFGDGSNLGAATDLMHMYNLFGDPTLKLRLSPGAPGM